MRGKNVNYRIFVEKKEGFQIEARALLEDFNQNLDLDLKTLNLLNVYDLFGFNEDQMCIRDSTSTSTCPITCRRSCY